MCETKERRLKSHAFFSKGCKSNAISTTSFSGDMYPPSSTAFVSPSYVKGATFAHRAVRGLQGETSLARHDQAHQQSSYCSPSPPEFSSFQIPSQRLSHSTLRTSRQDRMMSIVDLVEKEGEKKTELLFSSSSVANECSASGSCFVLPEAHPSERPTVPTDSTSLPDRQRKSSFSHPNAVDQLTAQHDCLRRWFSDAHNGLNVLHAKKNKALYLSECKEFAKAHRNKWPTEKEVSRNIAIELAPVAALKTWGYLTQKNNDWSKKDHLDGKSSSPGLHTVSAPLQHSLLLQQHARHHQIIQSQEKTWFRCLRCFHVFYANPYHLLTSPRGKRSSVGREGANGLNSPVVELSWVAKKRQEELNILQCGASTSTSTKLQSTSLRSFEVGKTKKSRNAQQRKRKEREKNEPHACPHCGSAKVQWMLEYIHHRTHIK